MAARIKVEGAFSVKRFIFLAVSAVLVIAVIVGCSGGSSDSNDSGTPKDTLTGAAQGHNGILKVSVTLEGEKITAVEVIEEEETPGIAGPALEEIPAAIVAANSAEVDVISGATVTCEAIMYAVNNALDPEKYPAP